MPRALDEAVVVITGASSGIGRAAALRFAARGSRVVAAARSTDALEELAAACRAAGTEAIAATTDVTDEDAVERLAREAVERFGRIDVWVNNAGVIAYGRFHELPAADFRRVIETNLFGQVHGARAAIPRFRAQGSGVLINVSSVWGRIPSPHVSAYVASKFAVRALSSSLHYENADCPDVHVATFLPQAVDTPIFDHAANVTGRAVRPIPPLVDVDEVAAGIVDCVRSPRREVTYGRAGKALELLFAFAPSVYSRVAPAMFVDGSFAGPEDGPRPGNLFTPTPGPPDGGWKSGRRGTLLRAFAASITGLARGAAGRFGR